MTYKQTTEEQLKIRAEIEANNKKARAKLNNRLSFAEELIKELSE